jgi:phytoene dehydrogenase-like protein
MVRNFGGEVLCDATVEQIIIENGRAVGVKVRNTSAGKDSPITEIRAKNIVCATSVFNLHNKLLPQDHPSVKEFNDKSKRSIVESVSTMHPYHYLPSVFHLINSLLHLLFLQKNGHVFLFCKIKGDATELELPRHNLWYFNSYDMDEAFDKYYADPVTHRPPTGM